jgi:hypothetical protein
MEIARTVAGLTVALFFCAGPEWAVEEYGSAADRETALGRSQQ